MKHKTKLFIITILTLFLIVKINFTQVVVSGPSMQPTLIGDSENGYESGNRSR